MDATRTERAVLTAVGSGFVVLVLVVYVVAFLHEYQPLPPPPPSPPPRESTSQLLTRSDLWGMICDGDFGPFWKSLALFLRYLFTGQ